ncbi:protein translocase subunit SecD [Thalassomonas sp. RHCl1]|uniref:protein translocase subunit SecD n=1 Tax=Thalassomonas sp. RHCl1 TaxID=2995320 RepID=UPI00248C7C9C|nr:protein translocase subunit SecD [Thalassomonas sp. RHCl1]
MMNVPVKKPRAYFNWQNLVIVITLILLLVSALPNFYSNQVNIQITPRSETSKPIAPQSLKALLAKQDQQLAGISTNKAYTSLVLSDETARTQVEQVLKDKLAGEYVITSTVANNAPAWLQALGGEPIKLGLDLSGGVLFVLDVDIDQALTERLNQISLSLKSMVMENKLRGVHLAVSGQSGISLTLAASSTQSLKPLLAEITRVYPELTPEKVSSHRLTLSYAAPELAKFRQQTMKQTIKTMRGRIEELGITEAVTQQQGKNRIRIELPGVHDPEQAKRIIGATASLEFYQLAANSRAMGIKRISDESGRQLVLNSQAVFTGSNIKNASPGRDQMGAPLVNLTLDSAGGKKMSKFSKENIGKPMVTVFSEYYRNQDNEAVKKSEVINVATIQSHLGAQFSITNMPSLQEAQELALLLRAGSLTAPVTIVKQQTIEATLGADNIDNGIKALTLGIAITLVFMMLWYRSLGLVANIALALNLMSLLGLMSLLPGAVLTLPGIAGLVLTVGMAVDTNVLIFERIKEELKRGRKVLMAIEVGYKHAFATILDANITTLITGMILYAIGYGPVKGFAVILCLGILTSMFTGVFVSKALTNLAIRENKQKLLGVAL